MKSILTITIGLAILLSIAGCGATQATSPEVPAPSEGTIVTEQVQVTQDGITVSGASNLPDGACILTRLVDDRGDLDWWPAQTCATVTSGSWELAITFGQNNAPDQLESGEFYQLYAWQKDNEAIQADPFPLKLAPPMDAGQPDAYPAPQSLPTSESTTPYP